MSTKGKKEKIEKLGPEEAKRVIALYMEKEYRPYGVTDLVLNLHNRINKATMIKVLDELVDEGVLIVKRYGKLSFYCFKEIQLDENMDVVSLETIKEITKEVNEYRIDLNEHRKVLTQLKSEPTDSELNILYDELKKENTRLRSMVEKYRSEIEENSLEIESSVIQIESREKALHKKYTSLKKVHKEVMSTLQEGIDDFSQKMEDLGIEQVPELSR